MKLTVRHVFVLLFISFLSAARSNRSKSKLKKHNHRTDTELMIGGGVFHDYLHGAEFVVALVRLYQQYTDYLCAGTIINFNMVLTSASCAEKPRGKFSDMASEISNGQVIIRGGTAWIEGTGGFDHPIWVLQVFGHVALIMIKGVFTLPYEKPIALVVKHNFKIRKTDEIEMFGWGEAETGGSTSEKLKSALIRIVPHENCKDLVGYDAKLHSCFESVRGFPCRADDGGPVVAKNILIGVLLRNYTLCKPGIGAFLSMDGIFPDITDIVDSNTINFASNRLR